MSSAPATVRPSDSFVEVEIEDAVESSFVWFDLRTKDAAQSRSFYEQTVHGPSWAPHLESGVHKAQNDWSICFSLLDPARHLCPANSTTASTGSEALTRVRSLRPDLILMDLQMPELDGATAIRRIRAEFENIQVLVPTTYDTDADISRAIEAGATGYLLKDARREELFQAVRLAAKGESVLSPRVAKRVLGKMRAPAEEALSPREIEILGAVARGLSNRAIARSFHISEATVKTHLLHVFAKLGVDDRTAAVTVALERGIIRLQRPHG